MGRFLNHNCGRFIALLSCIASTGSFAHEHSPAVLPGLQVDGSVLLPNQWSLRPVGKQVPVGDFPVNLAVHPSGKFVAVLHCGYSEHEVRIIELSTGLLASRAALNESFYGLTWSPDGTRLYASGAGDEVIHAFKWKDGHLSELRELRLLPKNEQGVPGGIAISNDGKALFVAQTWGQRVLKVSTVDGHLLWQHPLGQAEGRAVTSPDSERFQPATDPDAPFPYTCLVDHKRGRVYISLWAKKAVLVLDLKTGVEVARWPVGDHPNELALTADGRLFVAESNRNNVSVISAADGKVLEKLSCVLDPLTPPGSMPNSLGLSPDGQLLFVANANNNNLAVFSIIDPRRSESLGFIPVGWFPTSVRVTPDGKKLVVANGKGVTSAANPRGPFPGDKRPQNLQEYIGGLLKGTVAIVDLPLPADRVKYFGRLTKQVFDNSPRAGLAERPSDSPIPAKTGDASPIHHVIYVIKENRTYDQVFGDLAKGNGDARLCLFGEKVTPNQHALAREFVLLDNFYADGEVSADGHEWAMGAYATDFVEKVWPLHYGHNGGNKYDYPSEGRYPVAYPANGYLWNRSAEAGVSYRSYGEFTQSGPGRDAPAMASLSVLKDHFDPLYRPFDLGVFDVKRAERFIAELQRFEKEGDMPHLQVVRLGSDHTEGTKAGARTPVAMVADNDRAVGMVVEAVTRSKFWADTAIFILEDDAQNGPDHVDAHRIPALVISPYVRRHAIDSSLYSTTSMLRTIELILGLQPMSQFDAAARPLFDSFQAQPDLTPFDALSAQVDLDARNRATAWGARASGQMDFAEADRADDIVLNEVIWRSIKGADSPMPAPVRAAFFKSHPKSEDSD